jgi:hypothetical protein
MIESCLIYDIEIVKAIPPKNHANRIPGIEYCNGWHDHGNMGVSVIGAYDYLEDRYRAFCRDNFDAFQQLVDEREWIVGFNSIAFDNRVVAACELIRVPDEKSYDLLVELWRAAGLGPQYRHPTHAGFGLDAVCEANFGLKKSGHGALAPVDWQQGRIGSVIDYCLNDVRLTKRLLDQVLCARFLIDPRDRAASLMMRLPGESIDG